MSQTASLIWGPSEQFSDEPTADSALKHLPHRGQLGQPAVVREAAVTAERVTQGWAGRVTCALSPPSWPPLTGGFIIRSPSLGFTIRNPAVVCTYEFQVVNYLLINQKRRGTGTEGGGGAGKGEKFSGL